MTGIHFKSVYMIKKKVGGGGRNITQGEIIWNQGRYVLEKKSLDTWPKSLEGQQQLVDKYEQLGFLT